MKGGGQYGFVTVALGSSPASHTLFVVAARAIGGGNRTIATVADKWERGRWRSAAELGIAGVGTLTPTLANTAIAGASRASVDEFATVANGGGEKQE